MRRRLEAHVAASADGGVGGARSAGEESAVAQVTAVAQSTVSRLQELVAEKNKALIKAQAAMTDLRSDALKKQAEDRRTIEELNDLLFKQNQREIKSMRDAVDFGGGGVSGGAGELAGAAQFAGKSQAQLVALLQEREQAIEVLTMKYEQQRARHEVTEARLAEQAEARDGEMKRVAQTAAPKPQNTRILETLVARLKTQMSQKDKRLAQLKEAIKELEKKLVDAMQKAAEASARGAEARSGENAAVRSAGDSRATVLAAKLKKTQDELQKAKQREERWEEERERLVRESRSATDAAVRSSAAARRGNRRRGALRRRRRRRRGFAPRLRRARRPRRAARGREPEVRRAGEPREGSRRAEREAQPSAPRGAERGGARQGGGGGGLGAGGAPAPKRVVGEPPPFGETRGGGGPGRRPPARGDARAVGGGRQASQARGDSDEEAVGGDARARRRGGPVRQAPRARRRAAARESRARRQGQGGFGGGEARRRALPRERRSGRASGRAGRGGDRAGERSPAPRDFRPPPRRRRRAGG